jgi:hypothetical protein
VKTLLLRFTIILAVFFCIVSCSKDEPTPDYENYNKFLTANTWIEENTKVVGGLGRPIQSILGLDIYYLKMTFNENKTYESYASGGTWELSADNKTLLFDQNTNYKWGWQIHEITASSLKVSWTRKLFDADGNSHEAIIYVDFVPMQ